MSGIKHRPVLPMLGAVAGVAAVAGLDFATGTDIRVFPLYFMPLSFAATRLSRTRTFAVALLCVLSWVLSNWAGIGREDLYLGIRLWNVLAQSAAFAYVGFLLISLRESMLRERALGRSDPLTGLANSRAFFEQAPRTLSACRRHGRPIAVAYLDVDDFKRVNDTLGHHGGDDVLRELGATLGLAVRGADLAARLGGDEFAVLMPETDRLGAEAFLRRAQESIAKRFEARGLSVTVSMGAVIFEHAPLVVDELLKRADGLMYAAKAQGKDRFLVETVSGHGAEAIGQRP